MVVSKSNQTVHLSTVRLIRLSALRKLAHNLREEALKQSSKNNYSIFYQKSKQ